MSGGLGTNDAAPQSCLWILSVFDDFDAELVITRKTRSIRSSERIRLTVDRDINIPCNENAVYVYDGFPEFMVSKSSPQWSMGNLLGRFCDASSFQDMTVEAVSGFMTIYYEKTYPQHGFNATFSVSNH